MGQWLKPRILEFQRGGHLHLEGIKENVWQKWHLKWELRHGAGVRAFEEPGGRVLPGLRSWKILWFGDRRPGCCPNLHLFIRKLRFREGKLCFQIHTASLSLLMKFRVITNQHRKEISVDNTRWTSVNHCLTERNFLKKYCMYFY